MEHPLKITNSLTRKKEQFIPANPPFVGLYVCGPTVYSEVHIGNLRTFMHFDVIYRYLKYLGYKVRYVRNITDVGHLVNDADEGEDKIARKARLENLEPMEIVHRYTVNFHEVLDKFNFLPPSIEPTATGHIVEQIKMTEEILKNGYAYETNGSVYFDVVKYEKEHPYGELSGRVLEELMGGQRDLDGQDEKRNPADFALWKKAMPEHIMRWDSPWGEGFPGWHLECSVMSSKYLGTPFDIHGGGMDLKFPHHECEIAQSVGAYGESPVKYWVHTNMLTINGSRMGKSKGNAFTPLELISGDHPLLEQGYSAMTIRFFVLQSHYASTLDFSNEALQAAEKGYKRLMNAYKALKEIEAAENHTPDEQLNKQIRALIDGIFDDLNDDFNTPKAIAGLFELATIINSLANKQIALTALNAEVLDELKKVYKDVIEEILGLKEEESGDASLVDDLVNLLIRIRQQARANKDFATSDTIRDELAAMRVTLKDGKNGTTFSLD